MPSNLFIEYARRVRYMLERVVDDDREAIEQAGQLLANTLEQGGLIHTFGTGHSHLLAEEIYSRAGGLLPINVIQSAPLMLHEDAVASGDWERQSGLAAILLEHAAVDPSRDALIVISNSGRNAAPVEAAEWAGSQNVPVIALTSLAHSRSQPSLAPSGKRLFEVADVVLDNLGQPGDAAVEIRADLWAGATSTVVGAFVLQCVVLSCVEECLKRGVQASLLRSGNIAGAHAANARLVAAYPGRLADAYERLRRAQSRTAGMDRAGEIRNA